MSKGLRQIMQTKYYVTADISHYVNMSKQYEAPKKKKRVGEPGAEGSI